MEKVEFFSVSRFSVVVALGLVIFLTTTCTKTNERSFEELKSTYSLLGENHQLGLDVILADLKQLCANSPGKPDLYQLSKTVKNTSVRFTIERLNLNPEMESELTRMKGPVDLSYSKIDLDQSTLDLTNDQVQFTPREIYYLTRLDEILSFVYLGIDQCVSKIDRLEREIYLECSEEEVSHLFIATSVGANSIVYWYNNYELWSKELSVPEMTYRKGIAHSEWFWASLNRMGRADIAGGLVGACFGASAGGVGAIPGALAGACVASGNCGLVCLYEHLIEK